jgi:hypothetical protein
MFSKSDLTGMTFAIDVRNRDRKYISLIEDVVNIGKQE